ncbi:SRPBCC domain-containing protein [Roseibium sp. CAU 1637]|uniref:SRPBCC domain-containing protein n=1 Tax=Roseibium limicola TaxID=2816037 RepID=A0A939EMK8_9HYPH|nr:SRPBCC domain-containing protein [Roseibium limicola]MBO0345207.1 SRPBCC domain-containing protein [Roseibium limicola]
MSHSTVSDCPEKNAATSGEPDVPNGIRFHTWLPLSAERAWLVLTKAEHLKEWFGDHISLDATPGGFFREITHRDGRKVVTFGQMKQLEPPQRITMTWSDEDWGVETELELLLTGLPDGTLCTLTHSGWCGLDPNTAAAVRLDHEAGWKRHLTSLEAYCRLQLGVPVPRQTGPNPNRVRPLGATIVLPSPEVAGLAATVR